MLSTLLTLCLYSTSKCYFTSVISFLLNGFITLLHHVLGDQSRYGSDKHETFTITIYKINKSRHNFNIDDYIKKDVIVSVIGPLITFDDI